MEGEEVLSADKDCVPAIVLQSARICEGLLSVLNPRSERSKARAAGDVDEAEDEAV